MELEKHRECLKEVMKAIEDALSCPAGLLAHQRRLMFMISLGMQQLIEIYFHKLRVIKPGATIKHSWFRLAEHRLRNRLRAALTEDLDEIEGVDELICLGREIEERRDEIAYGSPLKNDRILREKIDLLLELKKRVGE